MKKWTVGQRVVIAVVASFVLVVAGFHPFTFFMLTGKLFPQSQIEVLNSPLQVTGWSTSGLHLANGRTVQLPGLHKIIWFNGVSSSGNRTTAKPLHASLDEAYLPVCIDSFEDMMPERFAEGEAFAMETILATTLLGMHHSIVALAEAGNSLIVDH